MKSRIFGKNVVYEFLKRNEGKFLEADYFDLLYKSKPYPNLETGEEEVLKEVLDLMKQNKENNLKDRPIIMTSVSPITHNKMGLFSNPIYQKIMGHENTYLLDVVEFMVTETESLKTLLEIPSLKNEPQIAFADTNFNQTKVGELLHSLSHGVEVVIKQVKDMGYNGPETYEEVRNYIQSQFPQIEVYNPGHIKGVFCDIEGTLLKDEKLQTEVFKELMKYEGSTPINIWTGGNLEKLSKEVRNKMFNWLSNESEKGNNVITNIPTKAAYFSKHFFKGSSVDVAIDDMPKEQFIDTYKIIPKTYIRV